MKSDKIVMFLNKSKYWFWQKSQETIWSGSTLSLLELSWNEQMETENFSIGELLLFKIIYRFVFLTFFFSNFVLNCIWIRGYTSSPIKYSSFIASSKETRFHFSTQSSHEHPKKCRCNIESLTQHEQRMDFMIYSPIIFVCEIYINWSNSRVEWVVWTDGMSLSKWPSGLKILMPMMRVASPTLAPQTNEKFFRHNMKSSTQIHRYLFNAN